MGLGDGEVVGAGDVAATTTAEEAEAIAQIGTGVGLLPLFLTFHCTFPIVFLYCIAITLICL